MKKERDGEYDDNTNSKKLKASTFPNTQESFVDFLRARERLNVKDKFGMKLAHMKEKVLEFNEIIRGRMVSRRNLGRFLML